MEQVGKIFKIAVSIIGTVSTYLFGGWSSLLGVLLAFVVIDYISGIMAAFCEGKLSSSVGFKGIAKKVMIFGIVALGHLVDIAIGTEVLMTAVVYFYLANELISILENAGRTGIPIPDTLKNAIQILNGKGEVKSD